MWPEPGDTFWVSETEYDTVSATYFTGNTTSWGRPGYFWTVVGPYGEMHSVAWSDERQRWEETPDVEE